MIPTLGPKVYKLDLLWATGSLTGSPTNSQVHAEEARQSDPSLETRPERERCHVDTRWQSSQSCQESLITGLLSTNFMDLY